MLAHAVMLSHSDVVGAWQRVQREPGNGRQSESSGLLQTIKFVSSPIDSTFKSYFFKYVFINFGRHFGANNKFQSCSLLTEWFVFFLHLSSFEELSSLYLRSEFQLRTDDSERAYNLPSAGRRSRWSLGELFRSLHRWSPQISLSQRQSSWWFKFLLAGWGSRGSRAGSAEGDAASRAEECRRRAVLLVQKFWYFPTL